MSVGTMKKIKFFSAVSAFIIGISLLIMIVFTGANNSDMMRWGNLGFDTFFITMRVLWVLFIACVFACVFASVFTRWKIKQREIK